MKSFNALVNRELLVLIAILASAVTMQVRQHMIGTPSQSVAASHAAYGRVCAPSSPDSDKARLLPADCALRTNVRSPRTAQPMV